MGKGEKQRVYKVEFEFDPNLAPIMNYLLECGLDPNAPAELPEVRPGKGRRSGLERQAQAAALSLKEKIKRPRSG